MMLFLRRFRRFHKEITRNFRKSNRVNQTIDHERRERIGNIQRDIVFLFNSSGNIHAAYLQALKKTDAMWLGRDNDDRMLSQQRGFDKTSEAK